MLMWGYPIMSIYSDHDQRLLDQQTGEEMDRIAQRKERREARALIARVGPAHVFADADNNGRDARVLLPPDSSAVKTSTEPQT